jgi:TonB family protein
MRVLVAAAWLGIGLASAGARPEDVRKLEPTSPWNIDYAEDSCALKREFGPPASRALLELRQFEPGASFSVLVAMDGRDFHLRPPRVRFLPEPKPRTIDGAIHFEDGRGVKAVKWYDSLAPDEPAPTADDAKPKDADPRVREGAVSAIEVGGIFGSTVVLATGEMHKPMEAMRACLDELLTHWGIDAAAHRTLSRRASPDGQASWALELQDSYPRAMLLQEKSAEVRVRMMVGPDGKPTECHIQIKSQDPSFETTACREMMKAARFKPALDAAGNPIASYYITRIIYTV